MLVTSWTLNIKLNIVGKVSHFCASSQCVYMYSTDVSLASWWILCRIVGVLVMTDSVMLLVCRLM